MNYPDNNLTDYEKIKFHEDESRSYLSIKDELLNSGWYPPIWRIDTIDDMDQFSFEHQLEANKLREKLDKEINRRDKIRSTTLFSLSVIGITSFLFKCK